MKRREQALLLLREAGQDEALLDEVLAPRSVDDEVIGFHCQQAAEKILKAMLSDLGGRFRKTHHIGSLMKLIVDSGCPLRPNSPVLKISLRLRPHAGMRIMRQILHWIAIKRASSSAHFEVG